MKHAARSARAASIVALLCVLCVGAPAAPAGTPQTFFDDATLGTLLEHIREFNAAIRQGLDGSTTELLLHLPRLWRELQTLEGHLQRSLPALREQLEALERELRQWPPPRAPAAPVIAV